MDYSLKIYEFMKIQKNVLILSDKMPRKSIAKVLLSTRFVLSKIRLFYRRVIHVN